MATKSTKRRSQVSDRIRISSQDGINLLTAMRARLEWYEDCAERWADFLTDHGRSFYFELIATHDRLRAALGLEGPWQPKISRSPSAGSAPPREDLPEESHAEAQGTQRGKEGQREVAGEGRD